MSDTLESVLKDYADNERDIQMAKLAIEGKWSTVSYPKGILEECLAMRPRIAKKIEELGGTVPVSEIEQLRAQLAGINSGGYSKRELDMLERQRYLDGVVAEQRLRAEHAEAILTKIASITANAGAMFFDDGGHDDWDAALAWMEKHLSFTPEESERERQRETINGWRDYVKDLTERIKALEEELEAYQWIPVGERLPEVEEGCVLTSPVVLVLDSTGSKTVDYYDYNLKDFHGYFRKSARATHWMPIPDKPASESK